MLQGPAGLALASTDQRAPNKFAVDLANAPLIKGVILSNTDNRVIAAAWEGDTIDEFAAVELIVEENLERWPIADGQGRTGYIFVAFEESWPANLVEEITRAIALDIVGVLMVALLLAINIRQRLSVRVSALKHATREIAQGSYDTRVPVTGKGPVAELGRTFNKMAFELGELTRRLTVSEERYSLAVNGSNEAIWDWNILTDRLYLSARYAEFVGCAGSEVPGLFGAWRQQIHPEDLGSLNKALEDHLRSNEVFQCECRVAHADGSFRWLFVRGKAVRDGNDEAARMVGSIAEISKQKRTQHQLDGEREKAQVTLQSIADAVLTIDRGMRVTYLNPAAGRILGLSADHIQGRMVNSVFDFVNESDAAALRHGVAKVFQQDSLSLDLGQAELILKSGERRIVEHNIAPLRSGDNRTIGAVIAMHDVTDRFQLLQKLAHQAVHDPLTQLVNRTGFERQLKLSLQAKFTQMNVRHCICYMDLDQFKTVNDTCGHAAGDELLRQIADLLRRFVRKEDTLARLGGDEFGLLLPSCPVDKAAEIAEKVRRAVESFRFSWEGKTFSVGLSVGLAPYGGQPGETIAGIMSSVDQACYIAKSNGRNRIHVYQPGDEESSRWHDEVQWVPHIHRAMDEGHFVLMAQPIVPLNDDLHSSERHFEILLRMRSKSGDYVSPGSFMPAAERYDLMVKLDRWVVKSALEMLAMAVRRDPELKNAIFGINISGAVLSDSALLDFVKEFLAAYRLPPNLLCFEITETIAIANFTHAHRFVKELKEIGCRFALDDFGSGFASFSYLKTMPVDYLKIDGSFVRHLVENDVDHTMVDIINQLGHVMNLKTIAEFVENAEILEALRALGVDYAQGYHLGKPEPLRELLFGEEPIPGLLMGA